MANAVIFQNVVDQRRILHELMAEGYEVKREDVAALSPYLTGHIKRFGDYVIDLSVAPQPLSEVEMSLSLFSLYDYGTELVVTRSDTRCRSIL